MKLRTLFYFTNFFFSNIKFMWRLLSLFCILHRMAFVLSFLSGDISYTCQSLATFWLNDFWYLSLNVEGKRHVNNKVGKKPHSHNDNVLVMSSYRLGTWPNKIFRDCYRQCLWDLKKLLSISSKVFIEFKVEIYFTKSLRN